MASRETRVEDPAAPAEDPRDPGGEDAPSDAALRASLLEAAPEAVRSRVAELVSRAVGEIPALDLPATVRPVARFAPAKRARRGAPALLAALGTVDGFAQDVVEWWREHRPDEWEPPLPEPVHAAAVAVLAGDADTAGATLREAGERADASRLRAERDAALARAERLAADLERVTAERDEARAVTRGAAPDLSEQVTKLRARLREQGVRVRRAEDAADEATAALEAGQGGLRREIEDLRRERDHDRDALAAAEARARRAAEEVEAARRSAHESRQADDARLALLVDTLAGAATGLRQELGLRAEDPRPGARPADLVGTRDDGPVAAVTDLAALDRVLGLPAVHLLVDGYNVTKTRWPALALSVQRERLVAACAPLVARTGAETTVVFDGAAVTGVPAASVRGVRVLFSEPGVIADDLIRRLVDAEPTGRPVVVVTSDRAVVDSVRRRGAHPVPAGLLLERLDRI